jgi:hypothetical protein
MTYGPYHLTQYFAACAVLAISLYFSHVVTQHQSRNSSSCADVVVVFTTGKTRIILKICNQYARDCSWLVVKVTHRYSSHTFLRVMLQVRENKTKDTGEFVSVHTVATPPGMRSKERAYVARQYKTFG